MICFVSSSRRASRKTSLMVRLSCLAMASARAARSGGRLMVKTRDLRGLAAFFAWVRAGLRGDFLVDLADMEEYYSVMDCHTTTDERQRYVGNIVGMMRR